MPAPIKPVMAKTVSQSKAMMTDVSAATPNGVNKKTVQPSLTPSPLMLIGSKVTNVTKGMSRQQNPNEICSPTARQMHHTRSTLPSCTNADRNVTMPIRAQE